MAGEFEDLRHPMSRKKNVSGNIHMLPQEGVNG